MQKVGNSLYLYVQTFICAIQILIAPNQGYLVYDVGELLPGIYGITLLRAWELLGVQRNGLLVRLNPLYEESTHTGKPIVHTDQSDG